MRWWSHTNSIRHQSSGLFVSRNTQHTLQCSDRHGCPTERTEVIFAAMILTSLWLMTHALSLFQTLTHTNLNNTTKRLPCRGRCWNSRVYKAVPFSQLCSTASLWVQRSSVSPAGVSPPSTGHRYPPHDHVTSSSGHRYTGGRAPCPPLRNRGAPAVTHR